MKGVPNSQEKKCLEIMPLSDLNVSVNRREKGNGKGMWNRTKSSRIDWCWACNLGGATRGVKKTLRKGWGKITTYRHPRLLRGDERGTEVSFKGTREKGLAAKEQGEKGLLFKSKKGAQ